MLNLTESDIQVPEELNFRQKVEKHLEVLKKLETELNNVEVREKEANDLDSLSKFKEVVSDKSKLAEISKPYVVAKSQAEALRSQGYAFSNWEGQVCKGSECTSVDPITAVFMIFFGALADELNKDRPFDPESNDLIKFIMQPAGGDNSVFVKIRSIIIPQDDQGEIAKYLRDPIKRPIEILQNWRDAVIPPSDNGEIARFIRDPIKYIFRF